MITASATEIERAMRELAHLPGLAERAIVRALNRSGIAGRQAAIEAMRQRYAVKASDARSKIALSTATVERPEIEVRSVSPSLSVGYFPHAPRRAGSGGRGRPPLTAEILRGQRKAIGGAFIATINGRPRVMRRVVDEHGKTKKTGTGRTQIESVYTVPLAVMLWAASVREAVERRALAMFDQRLAHEIERAKEGA